jgi:hypothetical protein
MSFQPIALIFELRVQIFPNLASWQGEARPGMNSGSRSFAGQDPNLNHIFNFAKTPNKIKARGLVPHSVPRKNIVCDGNVLNLVGSLRLARADECRHCSISDPLRQLLIYCSRRFSSSFGVLPAKNAVGTIVGVMALPFTFQANDGKVSWISHWQSMPLPFHTRSPKTGF